MNRTLPLDVVREDFEAAEPLVSYAYSYPHKSSYRRLDPPVPLSEIWRDEDLSRLSLYVHVPFCEMRCGFCNLFTQSQPARDQVAAYLETLSRQMRIIRIHVPEARFATFAMGGGTPTFLPARELDALLHSLETTWSVALCEIPSSVETSPGTATRDRLAVLADRGIERISLGVQSFVETERRALGRPQPDGQIERALDTIRSFQFPILNIDLIYGDPSQDRASWMTSVRRALEYEPQELYLYPLYVRPQTGLARHHSGAAGHRVDLYRAARELLLERGYEQLSLRCFRKRGSHSRNARHSCQQGGMIGLGCGARSYTQTLHYSTRFAVTQAGVRAIVDQWIAQSDADLSLATHGFCLSAEEQRRRFTILSLLENSGLILEDYAARFGASVTTDMLELAGLVNRGWLTEQFGRLSLTSEGMENSDVIGPLLYSNTVRDRLREFVRT